MSTGRQSKWDWVSHWSRMEQLYSEGLSIPKISKEIQCEGFMPSQRTVYWYFASRGYPTDRAERIQFLDNIVVVSQIDGETLHDSVIDEHPQTEIPRCTLSLQLKEGTTGSIPQDEQLPTNYKIQDYLSDEHALHNAAKTVTDEVDQELDGSNSFWAETLPLSAYENDSPDSNPQTSSEGIYIQQATTELYFKKMTHENVRRCIVPNQFHPFTHQPQGCDKMSGYRSAVGLENEYPGVRDEPTAIADNTFRAAKFHKKAGAHWSQASTSTDGTSSRTSSPSRSRTSCRSSYKRVSNQVQSVGNRSSYSRIDSGYYSEIVSPYSPQTELPFSQHSPSIIEFQGLYKVECIYLHEPKDYFSEVSTCARCCYSSIHNLGWSTRFLAIEAFRAELQTRRPGELDVADAAGNSVLHYAAASGAGYSYLKALIDAGVDPYKSNTAGQLFLHCLRPYKANSDCFNLDLLNLLNLLQPKNAFGHPENDGQTVLHILAAHINEPSLRVQIFQLFSDNGYPASTLDRFGRTANEIFPITYNATSILIDSVSFYKLPIVEESTETAQQSEILDMLPWNLQFARDLNAQNTIHFAFNTNNDYIDVETGDTVFHALSRVNTRLYFKPKDILRNIQHFVSKGLDTNRHNYAGEHPLTSFTLDRPLDGVETGAILAGYIDALLWKDSRKRDKNKISVNMKNRSGATALYNAAIRARLDTVRSLIEAGANVNARLDDDGNRISILQATFDARDKTVLVDDPVLIHMFKEVISHLELAGAVPQPTSLQERCTPEFLKSKNP